MLKRNAWRLSPEADPDVYEAELVQGQPHKNASSKLFSLPCGKNERNQGKDAA